MDFSGGGILLQQLINGLTLGSTYALIALGYTMVYGVLRLINFAHGEVYMVGAFTGLLMTQEMCIRDSLCSIQHPSISM